MSFDTIIDVAEQTPPGASLVKGVNCLRGLQAKTASPHQEKITRGADA